MTSLSRQEIGRLGEAIAARYLVSKGFTILGKNYRKPWGELDIISKKAGRLRFVEVKAAATSFDGEVVSHETYRLEDKVHPGKLKRIHRAIETYLIEKDIQDEWSIDVVTVLLDMGQNRAQCELIENVL